MKWLDPRKEPVAYLMALVILVNAVVQYKGGVAGLGTLLESAGMAILGAITRGVVVPTKNLPAPAEDVVDMDGIEDVSQDPDFWDDEVDDSE